MQPPRPWPKAPPRNHPRFNAEGLLGGYTVYRAGMDLFFCHGLEPKSPAAKMMTAVAQDRTEDLKALIAAHPETTPDFTNAHGITPLMVAAARGNVAIINVLADHPLVDLSQPSADGWSALHYAAHFARTDALQTLLRRRADFTRTNTSNETAFDLATEKPAQDIFWQHKEFMRHMKRAQPAHPRFAPAPDIKHAAPAAEKAPEPQTPAPLSAVFLQAALNVGLSTAAAASICQSLEKDIAAGRSDTLRSTYDAIATASDEAAARGRSIDFNWDRLFTAAARHGNLPALFFIAEKRDYLDHTPLTNALAAAIGPKGTANPDVVHWLLRWGADANASGAAIAPAGEKNATLAYQAFAQNRTAAFEQICLWGGDLKTWHMDAVQLDWETRVRHAMSGGYDPHLAKNRAEVKEALDLLNLRRDLKREGAAAINTQFHVAVQSHNLPRTMAVYAESRHHRFLRGAVALPADMGAQAMALALTNGKITFAMRLAADGHDLKRLNHAGLSATLAQIENSNTSSPARDFIRAHKAGSLQLPRILSVDEKYIMLRAQAARSAPSGRGYGI